MKRAWLAWVGLFCFLMPFVVQVIMISHSLNSIDPKASDASMQKAIGSMGTSFSISELHRFSHSDSGALHAGHLAYKHLAQDLRQPCTEGDGGQASRRKVSKGRVKWRSDPKHWWATHGAASVFEIAIVFDLIAERTISLTRAPPTLL